MKTELRLKKLNNEENNELEVFVNAIYNNLFREMDYLQKEMQKVNEPLHYLLLQTRLEEVRNQLRKFEEVADEAVEYVEVEEANETIKN